MMYGPDEIGKLPAWDHQREAFSFVRRKRRAMLAMDMGTGKSAVGVWVAAQQSTTLILCPKAVIEVWPKQFEIHSNVECNVVPLTKGTVKQKAENVRRKLNAQANAHRPDPLVIIMNHEAFWRPPMMKVLRNPKAYWGAIIVDECHKMKAPGGKASRNLHLLTKHPDNVRYVLGLTGTPMPHSPMDIYAQYRFIDQKIFGTSYTRFRARYAIMGGFEGRQVIGYQNEKEFARKLSMKMFEVSADEVLDLPEATHNDYFFDLDASERRAYKNIEKDLIHHLEDGTVTAANAMVKVLRLAQVCCGYVTDEDGYSRKVTNNKAPAKEKALAELMSDMPKGEAIVVFCRFHTDLEAVQRACADSGRIYRELSGRDNQLADWQNGGGDVIGVQIQAGGAGVDLTRARYCIYYSVGYSLGDYEQSLARVHRPGQERPVFYYHLIARNTIETKLYQALEQKKSVIDFVMEMTR